MKTPECAYSLVIPLHNEAESLKPLLEEILQTMTPFNERYEIIFVDDDSSDKSRVILEDFQKQLPEIIKTIFLTKRSGQTFVLKEGLMAVSGEVIITLDADLQNDPADIPQLLEKMEEGFDCVCGWRKNRQDSFLKTFLSQWGNILERRLTGLKIHDVSCTLRVYRRRCLLNIPLHWEGQHRFIPLSLSLQGFKVAEMAANHRERQFGRSKYSHKRVFRVVFDFFRILMAGGK